MSKILITICARGGSVGIPDKNIKSVCNKPLLQYTYDHAVKFKEFKGNECTISLSTDSDMILDVYHSFAEKCNYRRPKYLSTSSSGKIETIKHLLDFEENKQGLKFDYILDLDVSSPLRTIEDLNEAFEIIQNNENILNLYSVSPSRKNPYFNMVELDNNGFGVLVKHQEDFLTRQKSPKVFDLNASFYFYRRDFFEQKKSVLINKRSLPYVIKQTCFDIDSMEELLFLEFLIEKNMLDFEFS